MEMIDWGAPLVFIDGNGVTYETGFEIRAILGDQHGTAAIIPTGSVYREGGYIAPPGDEWYYDDYGYWSTDDTNKSGLSRFVNKKVAHPSMSKIGLRN